MGLRGFILGCGVLVLVFCVNACSSSYELATLQCDALATQQQRSECKQKKQTGQKKSTHGFGANTMDKLQIDHHLNLAQEHFTNDEGYWGVFELNKVIESHPEIADVHFSKGIALMNLGDNSAALMAFEQAIELNPEYAQAFYYKGLTLADLHRNKEAITAYQEAVRISPEYAVAFYNLGTMLRDYQRQKEAIDSYNHAYEIWNKRLKSNPYYFLQQPDLEKVYNKTRQYLREMDALRAPTYLSALEMKNQ